MKKYYYIKNILDLLFASIIIILLFPILLIISIAIKIDSRGSVLFLQKRLGKQGKEFKIYKFRTMVDNAINMGTGLRTDENDIRITKVGNILRKTSLDELPQIINILKGDMSFIGPRPPVPYHPRKYEEYSSKQKKRFLIKPGISGYAQVILRNKGTWDERIELDIKYVQKMSLKFDVYILFKTFYTIIKKENIYLSDEAKRKNQKLKKIDILKLPTPLEKIDVDNKNNYYIKRDDLTDLALGGNKARKIEYFLEDIFKNNNDYVVTYGSYQSNHCRIVSSIAAKYNKKCLLILSGSKKELEYNGNDLIYILSDTELVWCENDKVSEVIDREIEKLKNKGYNPYFIQGGGHGNLGTHSYVEAYKEIKHQSEILNIKFDYIFLASGTGTTQAGLIQGKEIYKGKEKIVGISIARNQDRGKEVINESLKDYNNEFNKKGSLNINDIIFIDSYRGEGYSDLNQEISKVIKDIFKRNSIILDPTYTGKAFYGMKEYIRENKIKNKNILFIHTGGTPIFFSRGKEIVKELNSRKG